jgi:adenine-specific DNA-methyltransferase
LNSEHFAGFIFALPKICGKISLDMIPRTFDEAFTQVKNLAARFQKDEKHFLDAKYQEAEVRQQFLDKFFVALGWDVYHDEHANPYEREVKIEKSVMIQGRGKRADYAFYTAPNFAQARFMAEAKKPARQLENAQDCFQAIRYGWNANTPLAVLTDFEQFFMLDSRYKPNVETALSRIVKKFHYTEFFDEEKFREIYFLFSREAVGGGALEKFAASLKKGKGAKQAKISPTAIVQPMDEEFLSELDEQRLNLAKAFKKGNPQLDGETLTEITQRTLDRLVFLRFLEDKLVEPDSVIDNLGKRTGSAWRDFIAEMPRLNAVYNGTLFRKHELLDSPTFAPDERTFAATRDWLTHANSPYDFNSIPIHILGSIYERFLGKTIETTEHSATVADKPEVRKAGGVYYTPEYIVRYIVENTVGKLIAGKTPEEISRMRFADIACGSGSFLLGVFDYLIQYHVAYYSGAVQSANSRVQSANSRVQSTNFSLSRPRSAAGEHAEARTLNKKHKARREQAIKQGICRETADGTLQLSISFKREILLNNIFGVDLDAQAVEVAQLSLYLKLLEEETTATKQQFLTGFREQLLPKLDKNIVHGNSLIDFDIMDGMLFDARELKQLNPMNFAETFPAVFQNGGFDAIVGNPPYVRQELFTNIKSYLQKKYKIYHGVADLYVYFFERYIQLLKPDGEFGIIVANKWLRANYGEPMRRWLKDFDVQEIVDFGDLPVFQGATTYPCVVRVRKTKGTETFRATEIKSLDFTDKSLSEMINENGFAVNVNHLDDKGWSLTDESVQHLLNKLRSKGVPLGEYVNGKIYRGVLTGLNEAFVIDAETKARLIAEDARSAELIKPFLFGRDIKRYENPIHKKYLIFSKRGIKIDNYPAIKNHLKKYEERLTPRPKDWNGDWNGRKPGSYKWYEIQDAVDYYEEFEKPKITYAEIATRGQFFIDEKNVYVDTTVYIMGNSEIYLLGLLNSKLFTFMFSNISSEIRGGFLRWKAIYMKQLPIRTIDFNNPQEKAAHDRIVELVEKILEAKKQLAAAQIDKDKTFFERYCESLDRQIDALVYDLYELTPEEIKIIETS